MFIDAKKHLLTHDSLKTEKSDINIDIALDKVARPVNIPEKSIGPLHLSKRILIARHKQQT
ncbi:hypothetical protein DA096_05565 [Vibrio rotiferianus]|nr:hypothetical protein DA095_10050 [Vibrio rotiferianus]TMX50522.1 hypothetical protein DA093_13820 [Vibrio rotiferianus]TMX68093.1 hypothetical protein DA096_05565 [Vibrio rotiferianus]CAH1542147.1 hypothetical protein THOG05_40107 [Vibrio rotiferianus]CAH1564763.1 hypothetical protein THOG10_150109 [Vibrio rotiferianus]